MINLLSPINQLGYGVTGLNITKSLSKITPVSLWCIGQPQVTSEEDAKIIRECINRGQFTDFDAPCIKIWHQHDMTQFVGKGQRIGFPIFELDKFNKLEQHHLSSLDKIFVCSEWAKRVVLNNVSIDSDKVHVIPLGVDLEIFDKSEYPESKITKFYNCGKWEIRKGHDVLIKIFNDAFEPKDNVELILMCDNPFYTESEQNEWVKLYKESKLGDKVSIIPRQTTQKEVYNIMKQCHCGIFPSRAEGWNLELLEMMACGRPVITTDYSAHSEFCTNANSYLAPINDTEVAYDGKWFHGQGNWAKIDSNTIDYMVSSMRTIYKQHQENVLKLNFAGLETAKNFTWENSARKITDAI
jgi:hypothetical protein